jgi:rRNA processing protein Gar1
MYDAIKADIMGKIDEIYHEIESTKESISCRETSIIKEKERLYILQEKLNQYMGLLNTMNK